MNLAALVHWLVPALLAATLAPARAAETARVAPAPDGTWAFHVAGRTFRCAVGRTGIARPGAKHEGDGATPSGVFPLRGLYFRPDKVRAADLPAAWHPVALDPDAGWCDNPAAPEYNRLVRLPFQPSHEQLWRRDDVYDLVVPIGYNDDPPVPGRGSAIFLHLARPGYSPTAGCVALAREDYLEVLKVLRPGDRIRIETGE